MLKNLTKLFLRAFLSYRTYILVGIANLAMLVVVYVIFFEIKPLFILPVNPNVQIDAYDDKVDNGNSFITSKALASKPVNISFVLKKGFFSPYVGIGFSGKQKNFFFDVSAFNRVSIQMRGNGVKSVFIYLLLKDSILGSTKGNVSTRHLGHFIEISGENWNYTLPFSEFKVPDWWYEKVGVSPASMPAPNWSSVQGISVATGLNPVLDKEQSFQISQIKFYRDNTNVILSMCAIQISVIVSMVLIFYFKRKQFQKKPALTINYLPVSVSEKQESVHSYLHYINLNFQDSNLTLEKVSRQFGINSRVIAEHIAETYKCNFKTYINQIRINEAKRLLKETDLNISEIAYKVGFSSPSHFNRVFKSLTGDSPSGYMQRFE